MTPMQIRKAGRWLGFTVLTAALVHMATVWVLPHLSMRTTFERTGERFGWNNMVHAPPVTADSRSVVRPSPDLAYSICAYDLRDGPIRVTVPNAADYLSISAYADNTDNFLVANDSHFGPDGHSVLIATEDQVGGAADGIALSPSRKGLVLIRRLVRGADDWPTIRAEQERMICAPE